MKKINLDLQVCIYYMHSSLFNNYNKLWLFLLWNISLIIIELNRSRIPWPAGYKPSIIIEKMKYYYCTHKVEL